MAAMLVALSMDGSKRRRRTVTNLTMCGTGFVHVMEGATISDERRGTDYTAKDQQSIDSKPGRQSDGVSGWRNDDGMRNESAVGDAAGACGL